MLSGCFYSVSRPHLCDIERRVYIFSPITKKYRPGLEQLCNFFGVPVLNRIPLEVLSHPKVCDFARYRVKQGKGGKKAQVLSIPIHPKLAEVLQAVHPHHDHQQRDVGRETQFALHGKIMAHAIAAAGLPNDCVFHGPTQDRCSNLGRARS